NSHRLWPWSGLGWGAAFLAWWACHWRHASGDRAQRKWRTGRKIPEYGPRTDIAAPQRYLARPARWHLPSVEIKQLHCRILIVGGVDASAGVHRTNRYGRVEFSATGICAVQDRFAGGRRFAAAKIGYFRCSG